MLIHSNQSILIPVDFSKQLTRNATFTNTRKPITGVLRFENNADAYISTTAGANSVYQTKQNIKVDDGPFFLNNLNNINNITVILTLEHVKY